MPAMPPIATKISRCNNCREVPKAPFPRCPRHVRFTPRKTGSQLPWIDRDLHYGIWTQMVADFSMMFRVPMPNPSPDLTDKFETALLSQVSEIADQVCDGMLVTGAAVPLKNRDGLRGPRNVVGFIGHARPSTWLSSCEGLLLSHNSAAGTRSRSHLR